MLTHVVHKAIGKHKRETMVNFEPTYNCNYHLSWHVRKWQTTFQ